MELEWDMDAARPGRGAGRGPGTTEPILNPVTDEEHRMLTVLPGGFTFYEAEVGAGTAKGIGAIRFDFAQRHNSLAHFAWDHNGMARTYDEFRRAQAQA